MGVCCDLFQRSTSDVQFPMPNWRRPELSVEGWALVLRRKCQGGDSNPYGFLHQILSLARLPIPPPRQITMDKYVMCQYLSSKPFSVDMIVTVRQAFRREKAQNPSPAI